MGHIYPGKVMSISLEIICKNAFRVSIFSEKWKFPNRHYFFFLELPGQTVECTKECTLDVKKAEFSENQGFVGLLYKKSSFYC